MEAAAIRRWAGCGAAVLLLHAWLLAQWPVADGAQPRERWLHLRMATPALAAGPAQKRSARPAQPSPPAVEPSRLAAPGRLHIAAARGDTTSANDASVRDIPVYPTVLPPSGTWRYRLLHNGRAGDAELQWRHEEGQYSARLEAREDGVPTLVLHSSGRLDDAGLAPERFVDQRGRRGAQAANFRRDAGAITYSGPALQRPLPAGAQDRLSLWLQLAAIVAAQPGRWSPGSRITTYASGAHGDADVWTWTVQGLAPADDGPAGGPLALQLHRDPLRPYDTEADAWLDPARGYLPVRLRWRNGSYTFELRLEP